MLEFLIRETNMRLLLKLVSTPIMIAMTACSSGNIKSARDYHAPAAPPVRQPYYNPYAAYGDANVTWTPPVWNRDGTIVKPADPGVEFGRPSYETAPWATGASGGSVLAPPGTF